MFHYHSINENGKAIPSLLEKRTNAMQVDVMNKLRTVIYNLQAWNMG